MIEHVSVPISNYEKSKEFYCKAIAPLGYTLVRDYGPQAAGFCENDSTSFWIVKKDEKIQPIHVALGAAGKQAVQDFYNAGLEHGGQDNGAPGFRTEYGSNYYAAFLLDPDGNNIEACYFGENAPRE